MDTKSNNDITVLLISFVILSGIVFLLPLEFLVNFAHDDSFFYLKIAQNIVKGSGTTFDIISSTNGFHPLYLIIISAIFYILKLINITSSEEQYLAIFIFHLLIIHLIILLILRFLKLHFNKGNNYWNIFIFLTLGISFVFIRDYGIESHISCLLISYYLYLKTINKIAVRNIIVNSVIITCLFLTRTDYLFTLIPFIIIADCFSYSGKNRRLSFLTNVGLLILNAATYFTINYIFWGHIQTTSGSIMNSFPSLVLYDNINSMFTLDFKFYNQFLKVLLFIAIFCLFLFKRNKNMLDLLLIGISSGLISNIVLHILFNNQGVREWYLATPSFLAILLLIMLFANNCNKYKYFVTVVLIIQLIYVFYYTRITNLKWKSAVEYAYYLKSVTDSNDIIYQYDMSGVVSYFSNRKIIDGDGLVNSFEYIDYLKGNRIQEYLLLKKVDYLSTLNYSTDMFSTNDIYIFRNEESVLSNLGLTKQDLYYEYPFVYKHFVGEKRGYFLLFKLQH